MSVNSTDAFSGPYTATGTSQLFPFTFTAASSDEVQVTANGLTVDPTTYTVTLNSDGTGAVNTTIAAGATVFVESNPDFQQSAQFSRFAPYFPDAINVHLDRAAIRDIALADRISRTFVIPRRFQDAAGKFARIGNDGGWELVDGVPGIPGAATAFRASLSELKAAAITDRQSTYDGSLWLWTPGNFSAATAADLDINIVKSNSQPLTVGAWLRQDTAKLTYNAGVDGAVTRPAKEKLKDTVSLRDYGAVGDGVTDDRVAFAKALAAGRCVVGRPGDVYYLPGTLFTAVLMPADRTLNGNGASIKLAPGGVGIRMQSGGCTISGWTVLGNGALYAVIDESRGNVVVDNVWQGNIGHFYFATGADFGLISRNRVDGLTASTEITAAIVLEGSTQMLVAHNRFEDIPTGWSIHARNGGSRLSEKITIANNQCLQRKYSATKTAMAGDTVFDFELAQNVLIDNIKNEAKVRIQLNGKPVSPRMPNGTIVYTIAQTPGTNKFRITFTNARSAGDVVTLLGYRGAENIQINTGCRRYQVIGNMIDGTADTGIIALSPYGIVADNYVANCGYTGIAVYGDIDHLAVANNTVEDCAQMDDGFSSPDDYRVPSVFAGGIFCGGENALFSDNRIINNSGTMRYGFASNKFCTPRFDGSAAITYSGNQFSGLPFADGFYFFPNQTAGKRMNSIDVDGAPVFYPAQIDLEAAWVTGGAGQQPPNTTFWTVDGTAGVRAVRDTTITRDGGVSIQTVAGEYLEFTATRAGKLRDSIVTLTFWAKNAGGSSYVYLTTALGGPQSPVIADITDTKWKRYTVRICFTDDLDTLLKIRVGANLGSANIQDLQIVGARL